MSFGSKEGKEWTLPVYIKFMFFIKTIYMIIAVTILLGRDSNYFTAMLSAYLPDIKQL